MESLSLSELREICKSRGIRVGGNKTELIERISMAGKVLKDGNKKRKSSTSAVDLENDLQSHENGESSNVQVQVLVNASVNVSKKKQKTDKSVAPVVQGVRVPMNPPVVAAPVNIIPHREPAYHHQNDGLNRYNHAPVKPEPYYNHAPVNPEPYYNHAPVKPEPYHNHVVKAEPRQYIKEEVIHYNHVQVKPEPSPSRSHHVKQEPFPPVSSPARALSLPSSQETTSLPMCQCIEAPTQVVRRVVKKDGPTQGRSFLTCPKPSSSQCKMFRFIPYCKCEQVTEAAIKVTKKEGPTKGSWFFTCSKPFKQQCKFFEWVGEKP